MLVFAADRLQAASANLAWSSRRQQPVVGDVVDHGPSRALAKAAVDGVVDPEKRVVEPQPARRSSHLAEEGAVGGATQDARQSLHGAHRPQPPGSTHGAEAQPPRQPPPKGAVEDVMGGLDEKHTDPDVHGEELADEELIASPHVVPGFEGAHDELLGYRGGLILDHGCEAKRWRTCS